MYVLQAIAHVSIIMAMKEHACKNDQDTNFFFEKENSEKIMCLQCAFSTNSTILHLLSEHERISDDRKRRDGACIQCPSISF